MENTTSFADLTTLFTADIIRTTTRRSRIIFVRREPWQADMTEALFVYIPPILIVAGTLGNFMSFLMMRSKEFRHTPSSFIYSVLAITDTAVLYTGLLRYWMTEVWDYDPRLDTDASCRIHLFTTYLLGHLSACYLMLLTIERAISVYFPMHCKTLCSKKRMVIAVVIATLAEAAFESNFLFNYRLLVHVSRFGRRAFCVNVVRSFDKAWGFINATLSVFMPFSVIFIGNMMIVLKLYISHRAKKAMTAQSSAKGTSSTTVVLIVVCSSFLVLTLPSSVYFIGDDYNIWNRKYSTYYYRVAMLLYYLNNTINFALYFVAGARFRTAFIKMLCGDRRSKGTNSTKGVSTSNVTMTEAV